MTNRHGGRLIGLTLLIVLVWRELVRFALGLALLVGLILLVGCAPAPATRLVHLPPPCIVQPAPPVPPGDTQRAAALYIERLHAWGATGWACIQAQHERAGANGKGGAGEF